MGLLIYAVFYNSPSLQEREDNAAAAAVASEFIVRNNPSDGSVPQVMEWLNEHIKNSPSIRYTQWSPVEKNGDKYIVKCEFRTEDPSGTLTSLKKRFLLDEKGKVVSVSDYRSHF